MGRAACSRKGASARARDGFRSHRGVSPESWGGRGFRGIAKFWQKLIPCTLIGDPLMRYDDREKPALAVVLSLLGWLAIFVSLGLALIRIGYYTAPLPGLAWTEITSTAVGGILFLTFAGIIRGLHRIEQAIRETRAAPLAGLSARAKAGRHIDETI
jgi:hypothetical protein